MLLEMRRKADASPVNENHDGPDAFCSMMLSLSDDDRRIFNDEYDIMFGILSTGERKTYRDAFDAAEPIIIERMTERYGRA